MLFGARLSPEGEPQRNSSIVPPPRANVSINAKIDQDFASSEALGQENMPWLFLAKWPQDVIEAAEKPWLPRSASEVGGYCLQRLRNAIDIQAVRPVLHAVSQA